MIEIHREHGISDVEYSAVDGLVGLGSRVRLHVDVVGAEEFLRARNREILDLVDLLTSTVVAAARVALGVFVRQYRAGRLEDGLRNEVLRRDEFQRQRLPAGLQGDELRDLRIRLGEGSGHSRRSRVAETVADIRIRQ